MIFSLVSRARKTVCLYYKYLAFENKKHCSFYVYQSFNRMIRLIEMIWLIRMIRVMKIDILG